MGKTNQARYTLEFKLEAVRLVVVGQSIAAVAPNLIQRDFSPTLPNRVWTTDITYLDTSEGWLYLTVMLDLFNRQVVGWSIQPRRRSS